MAGQIGLDNTETVVTRWRKQACRGFLSSIHPSLSAYSLGGQDDILGAPTVDFPTIVKASFRFLGCKKRGKPSTNKHPYKNNWHGWTQISHPFIRHHFHQTQPGPGDRDDHNASDLNQGDVCVSDRGEDALSSPSVFITRLILKLRWVFQQGHIMQLKNGPNQWRRPEHYIFVSDPDTLFKMRLQHGPEEGWRYKKIYTVYWRYGCQHPRNCSLEPMMDKGSCTFEE